MRVVHGDKELAEKLGRNDLCPCGSGRRFQEMLPAQRALRRLTARLLLLGNDPKRLNNLKLTRRMPEELQSQTDGRKSMQVRILPASLEAVAEMANASDVSQPLVAVLKDRLE